MKARALKSTVIAVTLALSIGSVASANSINARAMELAGQQKFDQALAALSQQDARLLSGYDHRFLKARILSWAGKYGQARSELTALKAAYPDNADVTLAMGNLNYYQGRLDAAELHYQAVLNKYPDYQDARTGLENVRKAKAETASTGHQLRVDGSLGGSRFNDDALSNWNNQFFRVEYSPETIAYHASVERYKRFEVSDVQLKAGLSDAQRGGWDWGLEAGLTPSSDFRPDFNIGARLGHSVKLQDGTVLYPNVTYSYDDYDSGVIHNIQPGIVAYLDEGIVLTGRLIATLQKSEPDQLGWLTEVSIPVTEQLQLRGGYANAPEAIDGLAISTQSLFGGLTYSVSDDLDVHINLARDDREDSYVRNSANVGFTYKR